MGHGSATWLSTAGPSGTTGVWGRWLGLRSSASVASLPSASGSAVRARLAAESSPTGFSAAARRSSWAGRCVIGRALQPCPQREVEDASELGWSALERECASAQLRCEIDVVELLKAKAHARGGGAHRCSACVGAATGAGGSWILLPRPALRPRRPPPRPSRCWAAPGARSETAAATSSSCELRPSSPSDDRAPGLSTAGRVLAGTGGTGVASAWRSASE